MLERLITGQVPDKLEGATEKRIKHLAELTRRSYSANPGRMVSRHNDDHTTKELRRISDSESGKEDLQTPEFEVDP